MSVTVSTEDPLACPQGTVTFTCTVDRGVDLEWIADPFFTQQNQVLFLHTDLETDPTRTVTSSGVTFHAVLTHADPVPGSTEFFTLQSTLSTTASATTNGTVIVCQDSFSGTPDSVTLQLQGQLVSVTILLAGKSKFFTSFALAPPPHPSGVQYNVISHGTSHVTGDIEWNSSMDSSVDNFTITVSSLNGSTVLMTTVQSSPLHNVILNYNTNYSISIRGRNCVGSSEPTAIQYMKREHQDNLSFMMYSSTASPSVGCPAPSEPVNGSVSGFTSANVGSEVTYHCDTGLTLVGESVAMCTSDLVWVPNGSEVMCQRLPSGKWSDRFVVS